MPASKSFFTCHSRYQPLPIQIDGPLSAHGTQWYPSPSCMHSQIQSRCPIPLPKPPRPCHPWPFRLLSSNLVAMAKASHSHDPMPPVAVVFSVLNSNLHGSHGRYKPQVTSGQTSRPVAVSQVQFQPPSYPWPKRLPCPNLHVPGLELAGGVVVREVHPAVPGDPQASKKRRVVGWSIPVVLDVAPGDTVGGQNPFRTTLNLWEPFVCCYL